MSGWREAFGGEAIAAMRLEYERRWLELWARKWRAYSDRLSAER